MGLQEEFSEALDTIHNVFCLCPSCHRAIHHADEQTARNLLSALSDKRDVLGKFALTVPELYSLYAIEEIV
jgi:hypothetical protein